MRNQKNHYEYFVNQKVFVWKFQTKKQTQETKQEAPKRKKIESNLQEVLSTSIRSKLITKQNSQFHRNPRKKMLKMLKNMLHHQNKKLSNLSQEIGVEKHDLRDFFEQKPSQSTDSNQIRIALEKWIFTQMASFPQDNFFSFTNDYFESVQKDYPSQKNELFVMQPNPFKQLSPNLPHHAYLFPIKINVFLPEPLEEKIFIDSSKSYNELYVDLFHILQDLYLDKMPMKTEEDDDKIPQKLSLDLIESVAQEVYEKIEHYNSLMAHKQMLVNFSFSSSQKPDGLIPIEINIPGYYDMVHWNVLGDDNIFSFVDQLVRDVGLNELQQVEIAWSMHHQVICFLERRYANMQAFFKDEHIINNHISMSKSNVHYVLTEDIPLQQVKEELPQLEVNEVFNCVFRNKQYLNSEDQNYIDENYKSFYEQRQQIIKHSVGRQEMPSNGTQKNKLLDPQSIPNILSIGQSSFLQGQHQNGKQTFSYQPQRIVNTN